MQSSSRESVKPIPPMPDWKRLSDNGYESTVVITIVHFNSLKDTLACLQSVYSLVDGLHSVIVLDNGSDDANQIKEIKRLYPETACYRSEYNMGSARGSNEVVRLSESLCRWQYVLILDNDVVLDKECLNNMVKTMQLDEEVGIVGACILRSEPKNIVLTTGGKIVWWLGIKTDVGFNLDRTRVKHIGGERDWVDGCAMLIRKQLVDRIGLFNPRWVGFEDLAFCVRARLNGFKVVCNTDAVVWHKQSGSKRASHFEFTHKTGLADIRRYMDAFRMMSPHPSISAVTAVVFGYPIQMLTYLLLTPDRNLRLYYHKRFIYSLLPNWVINRK